MLNTMSQRALTILGCVLALTACGGSDDDAAGGARTLEGSGTVTGAWADFCTATFTEDAEILDGFGDARFTARSGEEYLVSDAPGSELLFLTSEGPEAFEVMGDESGTLPLTESCAPGTGVTHYAAFTDVTVYAEEGLDTVLCKIAGGTALPAGNQSRGYALVGDSLSLDGPATYEIFLDSFSAECGGSESGYVSVPQVILFGSHTWLVPFAQVLRPG